MVMLYLTLGNGSGVDLERQVKRHHRLALVTLPLPLTLTLDARCGYSLNFVVSFESVTLRSVVYYSKIILFTSKQMS